MLYSVVSLTVAEEHYKDGTQDHNVEESEEKSIATERHELVQLDEADNLPDLVLVINPSCESIFWIHHQEEELEPLETNAKDYEPRRGALLLGHCIKNSKHACKMMELV